VDASNDVEARVEGSERTLLCEPPRRMARGVELSQLTSTTLSASDIHNL
jgi:hypothetical protein